jgi:hypothetical protein
MLHKRWMHEFQQRLLASCSTACSGRRPRPRRITRSHLEELESRTMPSAVSGATGGQSQGSPSENAEIAALQAQISAIQSQQASAQSQLQTDLLQIDQNWLITSTLINSTRQNQQDSSVDDHQENVVRLGTEHQQSVDRTWQEHTTKTAAADELFDQDRMLADATWTQTTTAAQSAYDAARTAALSEYDATKLGADEMRTAGLNAALVAFDSAKETIANDFTAAKASALNAYNTAEVSAWSSYQTAVTTQVAAYESAVESAITFRDSLLASFDDVIYDSSLIDADAAYQGHLADANAAKAHALATVSQTYSSAFATALAAYNGTVQTAGEHHAAALEAADDTYDVSVDQVVNGYLVRVNNHIGIYNSGLDSAYTTYSAAIQSAKSSRDQALGIAALRQTSAVQSANDTFDSNVANAQDEFRSFLREKFGTEDSTGEFASSLQGIAESFVEASLKAAGQALKAALEADLNYSSQYRLRADAYADTVEQLRDTQNAHLQQAGAIYSQKVQEIVDRLEEKLSWNPPAGLSMEEYYAQKTENGNNAKKEYWIALLTLGAQTVEEEGNHFADSVVQPERVAAKALVDWATENDYERQLASLQAERTKSEALDQAGATMLTALAGLETSIEKETQAAYKKLLDALSKAVQTRDDAIADAGHDHAVAVEDAHNAYTKSVTSAYKTYTSTSNTLYQTLESALAQADRDAIQEVTTAGLQWVTSIASAKKAHTAALATAASVFNSAAWSAVVSAVGQSLAATASHTMAVTSARVDAASRLFNDPDVTAIEQAHATYKNSVFGASREAIESIVAAAQCYVSARSTAGVTHDNAVAAAAETASNSQAAATRTLEDAKASIGATHREALANAQAVRDNALAKALADKVSAEDDATTAYNKALAAAEQRTRKAYSKANDEANRELSAADKKRFDELKSNANTLIQSLITQARQATSQLSEADFNARKQQLEKVRDAIKARMASEVELAVTKANEGAKTAWWDVNNQLKNSEGKNAEFFASITPGTCIVPFPAATAELAAQRAREYSDEWQNLIRVDADGSRFYRNDSPHGALEFAINVAPLGSANLPEPEKYQPRPLDRTGDSDGYTNGITRFLREKVISNFATPERLAQQGGLMSDLLLTAEVATEFSSYVDPTPLSDILSAGTKVVDGRYKEAIIQIGMAAAPGGLARITESVGVLRRVGISDVVASKQVASCDSLAGCFVAGTPVVIGEEESQENTQFVVGDEAPSNLPLAGALLSAGVGIRHLKSLTRKRPAKPISATIAARRSTASLRSKHSMREENTRIVRQQTAAHAGSRWSRLTPVLMILCFATGGWLTAEIVTERGNLSAATAPTVTSAPLQVLKTKPIEDVQLGDRLIGYNPLRNDTENASQIRPVGWRRIQLQLSSGGTRFDIDLLRPLSWLTSNNARVGSTLWLSMPEMGVEGDATVTAIAPCPTIEDDKHGHRPVVTGTFRHNSTKVVNLMIEGLERQVGVTDNHPVWSETRSRFVRAGELKQGEIVRTLKGRYSRVLAVAAESARGQAVYNLEVDGEHVYHVAESGVLVHNTCIVPDPRRHANDIHRDHIVAETFGGTNAPSNIRDISAPLNLRKGGMEGSLRKYEEYLKANGMSPVEARSVIQDEIDILGRDALPAPLTSVFGDNVPPLE